MVSSQKELARKLKELEQHLQDHDEQIQAIFEAIQQLISLPEKSKKKIGFTVKERKTLYGKKTTKKQATRKSQCALSFPSPAHPMHLPPSPPA
jgi:septation ring formation regulator EzrA